LIGHRSVAEELIHRAQGLSVVVVDAESEERRSTDFVEPSTSAPCPPFARRERSRVF
jgi:hypothetical protein